MSMRTVIPTRLQQEPTDWKAYDNWQTREGLLDASDSVRKAWKEFQDTWDAATAIDADEPQIAPLAFQPVPQSILLAGRAFGLVAGQTGARLQPLARSAFVAWRSRVLAIDPDLWGLFWRAANGDTVAEVAAGFQWSHRYAVNAQAMLVRWYDEACRLVVDEKPIKAGSRIGIGV